MFNKKGLKEPYNAPAVSVIRLRAQWLLCGSFLTNDIQYDDTYLNAFDDEIL